MFDIKWIRDNATAFDASLKRRGLEPLSGKLIELDEGRRATLDETSGRAGPPERRVKGDRQGEGVEGRGRRGEADGRGGDA